MKYFSFLISTVVCISACSSSDDDTIGIDQNHMMVENSIDGVLISGGSCSDNEAFLEENGPQVNLENISGYFECSGTVNTEIDTPGESNTGDGAISISSTDISLDTMGVEFFPDTAFENHSGAQLYIHDGEFRIVEQRFESINPELGTLSRHKIDWGIYNGSIVLSLELGSSNANSFEVGTFEYVGYEDVNDPQNAGMNTIFSGTVFLDKNDSGDIDSIDEILEIVQGNINISGAKPDWSISIDVVLDTDETITGYFNGDYIDVPIADASATP